MSSPSTKHGTHSSYVSGCRCEACREAHRLAAERAGWNRRIGKRGESKRRWDRENRGWCACGNRVSRGHPRCLTCENLARAQAREARQREIQRLWHEGLLLREIAQALDSTKNSIAREIHDMRADGWDVPHRYAMRNGKRVAA